MTSPEERAAELDETIKADKARKADAAKADAEAGAKLDKVLACLDSLGARMDAFESGPDDEEPAMDAKRKRRKADDNEEPEMDDTEGEARRYGEPVRLAADSMFADVRRKGETQRDFDLRIRDEIAEAQCRADAVSNAHGFRAPKPMDGEMVRNYRVRLLKSHQSACDDYKNIPLAQIAALPPELFDAAERRIYADSMAASSHPEVSPGFLRQRKTTDESCRQISTLYGQPRDWMREFSGQTQRVTQFRTPNWSSRD